MTTDFKPCPPAHKKVPACYAKRTKRLHFGRGNAKLTENIVTFDLPAGWSCPGALQCLTKADKETGKIWDGPDKIFRCYAASMEAAFPSLRRRHWQNLDALKECRGVTAMADLILDCMPESGIYRLHAYGDFFSQSYFDAWVAVARQFPARIFYAYSKSLHFYMARKDEVPANLRIVASWGGKYDNLISEHNLRSAKVFFSEAEIEAAGLRTDHTDALAYAGEEDFALLIHGTQPAGSPAAAAWKIVKSTVGGYSLEKKMALTGSH